MSQAEVIDKARDAVNFTDKRTISRIAKRAATEIDQADAVSVSMDITVVHANVGLKLGELLEADSFNFAHDICGIDRHLNRETGQLEGFFLPRFAVTESDAA